MKIYCVRRKGNIILQYSAITPCCHIRTTEGAKYAMIAHRSNKTITEALNGPNFCFKCLPYALLFKRQRCNEAYLFYVIKPPTDFVCVVFVFRTCTLIYAQSIRFSNVCVYYILSAYRLRSAFYVSFKGLYLNSLHFDQDINDYQQQCDTKKTTKFLNRRHGCQQIFSGMQVNKRNTICWAKIIST